MTAETPKFRNERPYLRIHATDTDQHAAQKILFIDDETKEIRGPCITNGDIVTVGFREPEVYEFDCEDGSSMKFLVRSIQGNIVFTHALYENGIEKQSAPTRVDFVNGFFMAIDPKTHEEWRQDFSNCMIALRVHDDDTVNVARSIHA